MAGQGAGMALRSPHALAEAGPGAEFELELAEGESQLSCRQGGLTISSLSGSTRAEAAAHERVIAGAGRLNAAFRLPKRELGELESRWQRARLIQGQAAEILKGFKGGEPRESKDKKEIRVRRKLARERFERAKEEIKKERGSK
jgi:hypothetical protein